MQRSKQVCHPVAIQKDKSAPITKDKFKLLLATAWGRVWPSLGGQMQMAAAMGETDVAAVQRGSSASNLPEAHKIFNSLCADPTALDEILSAYGFRIVPLHDQAANDLSTAAGTIDAMAAMIRSQDDGVRDHNETLGIAALLRPHIPALLAVISEADRLRGAA